MGIASFFTADLKTRALKETLRTQLSPWQIGGGTITWCLDSRLFNLKVTNALIYQPAADGWVKEREG